MQVHQIDILSVAQYKWSNQFDPKVASQNDYREHYAFGDSILAWDESTEEIQSLGNCPIVKINQSY